MKWLVVLLLTACTSVDSSLHYSRGATHFSKKNYEKALIEFEQAANLNPEMARYHNDLSATYVRLNNLKQAWIHARKAVLCPYKDGLGDHVFRQFCNAMIIRKGLSKPGTPVEVILEELGPPDIEECGDLQYGLWIFVIKDGKVLTTRMIPQ